MINNPTARVRDCDAISLNHDLAKHIEIELNLFVDHSILTEEESEYIARVLDPLTTIFDVIARVQSAVCNQSSQIVIDYLKITSNDLVVKTMRNIKHSDTQRKIAESQRLMMTIEKSAIAARVRELYNRIGDYLNLILTTDPPTGNADVLQGIRTYYMTHETVIKSDLCVLIRWNVAVDPQVLAQKFIRMAGHEVISESIPAKPTPLILNIPKDRPFNPVEEWHTEPYDVANFPRVLVEYANGEYYCGRTNTITWTYDKPNALCVKRWMFIPE